MPEISVIVPVYRVEKYIKQCVESIRAQTFSDIEIILVDDGSPDDCGRICDEYAKTDPRIRVIHQANGGLSAARNTGIRHAAGRFITFVDSDDMISPECCETLFGLIDGCEYDFVVCASMVFNNRENTPSIKDSDQEIKAYSNVEYLGTQLETGFSAWGKLFRTSFVKTHPFFEGKLHEDLIFCSDLARDLNNGVCCTGKKLYYYRQNDSGIMSASKKKCSPDRVFAGRYLYETVKDNFPELTCKAFAYAVKYPWSFIDGIYVRREFKENKRFINDLRSFLKEYKNAIIINDEFSRVTKHRMKLFAASKLLYGCNAYARLARVYLYRLLKKDAYADGHGI